MIYLFSGTMLVIEGLNRLCLFIEKIFRCLEIILPGHPEHPVVSTQLDTTKMTLQDRVWKI